MALIKCNECGKEISDSAKVCVHCGCPIEKKEFCSECGKEVSKDDEFCPNCGMQLKINITDLAKNIKIDKIKFNNKYIFLVILIIVVLLMFFVNIRKDSKIDLNEIFSQSSCDSYYCELADDGSYITIDTNPLDLDDYSSYSAADMVEEMNDLLGFSDYVYSRMESTRALDGTLVEENDKIKISWTYHPDKGLRVVYSVK